MTLPHGKVRSCKNYSQQRQWSTVMSQKVQVTLCWHPHTLLPSKLSLIILLDLQQTMAAHDQPNFGKMHVHKILISHSSTTFHQSSTDSCAECCLDAVFRRNMLGRLSVNSRSKPVQDLWNCACSWSDPSPETCVVPHQEHLQMHIERWIMITSHHKTT